MRLPFWDSWLYGGEIFTALLPSVRMVWIAGFYGSGKTVFATFLAAHLLHKRLVARVHSNIVIKGAEPVIQYVPGDSEYYSPYLEDDYGKKRRFGPGDMLPVEDAAIVFDEAGRFLKTWSESEDYVAALRKTNLYLFMPSIWPPVARLQVFEVRRTRNLYGFGIPAWEFTWYLTNGKSVAEKGRFYLWRPSRMFGVAHTFGWPKDDGGLVEALEWTFELDEIRERKQQRDIKRKVAKVIDFGESMEAATNDMIAAQSSQMAMMDAQLRMVKHGRK